MVDLVGFEPTTSSMPFPSTECGGPSGNGSERHRRTVFMRVPRMFPALHVCLSDMTSQHTIRIGISGLRHNPRHRFRANLFMGTPSPEAEPPRLSKAAQCSRAGARPHKSGSRILHKRLRSAALELRALLLRENLPHVRCLPAAVGRGRSP